MSDSIITLIVRERLLLFHSPSPRDNKLNESRRLVDAPSMRLSGLAGQAVRRKVGTMNPEYLHRDKRLNDSAVSATSRTRVAETVTGQRAQSRLV
jgi:hypothetical protein